MVRSAVTVQKIVQSLRNSLCKMQKGMCGMSNMYEAPNYSFPNQMIPSLKNLLKFFHHHTYWLSPPSLLRFCCRGTHKCFRKRVTIFFKNLKKSARESLFLVVFKLEFQLSTGVLNAVMWDVFVAKLL